MERWARFMAANPLDTSGLVDVFVTAPHASGARRRGGSTEVRKAVSKSLKAYPERSKDAPSSRIGVVDWADWFPDRHMLTEEFMDLVVRFPLGRDAEHRWVDVPLMSASFDPDDAFDPLAVVRNSSVLGHVPHWLRTADPEAVVGTPLSRWGKPLPGDAAAAPGPARGEEAGRRETEARDGVQGPLPTRRAVTNAPGTPR